MNDVIDIGKKEVSITNEERRQIFQKGINDFEDVLKRAPGAKVGHEMDEELCPLKHTFVDGAYVREIFMPKGLVITSKIHKICHPYFLLKGKCSVLTEQGTQLIEAPFYGVTPAGTKRLIYVHEDTVWVTVHSNPSNTKDLSIIEEQIIAKDFSDPELPHNKIKKIESSKEENGENI